MEDDQDLDFIDSLFEDEDQNADVPIIEIEIENVTLL